MIMSKPAFRTKRATWIYEIARRLYHIFLIAYVPLMMILTLRAELKPSMGLIDFGYSFSLLLTFIATGPFFVVFIIAGLVVNRILCKRFRGEATEQRDGKLVLTKRIITASIVALTVLLLLFVPYSTIRYGDGGTVKTDALAYTVMEWRRGKDETETSPYYLENHAPYGDEEQHTCIYFFPHNFKSYDELWELKH